MTLQLTGHLDLLLPATLDWLSQGLLNASGWHALLYLALATHVTSLCITLYLHRAMAHRSLMLKPAAAHPMRLWLWLTTGMVTQQWVAIHRKHHARCEQHDDPHSPQAHGLSTVLLKGAELYRNAARDCTIVESYGHGTPQDWIERRLYSRFTWQGCGVLLVLNLALFGAIGLAMWAVQMLWTPMLAAGVINGLGHAVGYRNFETRDRSHNLMPWGLLMGGEELHNNHHAFAASARFSQRWWELDIGYVYARLLQALGLARLRVAPAG
jgi:stearoyl-CoA desaturase (delta-9 desaturase)